MNVSRTIQERILYKTPVSCSGRLNVLSLRITACFYEDRGASHNTLLGIGIAQLDIRRKHMPLLFVIALLVLLVVWDVLHASN